MPIITIDSKNIDSEHICCAIGNDKENVRRAESKKDWMRERFAEGLVFKRLDQRGKVFIEYMPIEKVWKPLIGENYLVINCLWVSGQFKGKGYARKLLEECIRDAREQKKDGIAVVTGSKVKPFMTDRKFYLKHGFEVADTAEPYFELLVLRLNQKAELPRFTESAKTGTCGNKKGFTFVYSCQCPFMEEYVRILSEMLLKRNIPYTVQKLANYQEAQACGTPFGTLGIFYAGEFATHELMPEKKFEKYIDEMI